MKQHEVESLLRARGYSLTGPRRAILAWLDHNPTHPTAYEVFDAITKEFPLASRATVYNTLALLEELGAVTVVYGTDREARYDPNVEFHHHRICPVCGRMEDVDAHDVELRVGGRPVSGKVSFEARCGECGGKG